MKRKRNLFMSATLMCVFITGAFSFDNNAIYWMWEDKIEVSIILGILVIVFGTFWIIEQKKLRVKKNGL